MLFSGRIIPFDADAARHCAQMGVAARNVGLAAGHGDGYIAATAAARGFTVATRNTVDFETTGVSLINPGTDQQAPAYPSDQVAPSAPSATEIPAAVNRSRALASAVGQSFSARAVARRSALRLHEHVQGTEGPPDAPAPMLPRLAPESSPDQVSDRGSTPRMPIIARTSPAIRATVSRSPACPARRYPGAQRVLDDRECGRNTEVIVQRRLELRQPVPPHDHVRLSSSRTVEELLDLPNPAAASCSAFSEYSSIDR